MSAEQVRLMQEQAQVSARIGANIENAVAQQTNLTGWTTEQLVQQFGQADNVGATYNVAGSEQDEKYIYLDGNSIKYEFEVTIQNGTVSSVHYSSPHTLPPDQIPCASGILCGGAPVTGVPDQVVCGSDCKTQYICSNGGQWQVDGSCG